VRELKLLRNLVAILRAMPQVLRPDDDTYFSRNPERGPITAAWWPRKSWYPALAGFRIFSGHTVALR